MNGKGPREDWAENWSYDQAGFVRPGNLAIFSPTAGLRDYHFEFLGQIENHALTWVYRAKDTRNYYQGKLMITRGGASAGGSPGALGGEERARREPQGDGDDHEFAERYAVSRAGGRKW